MSEMRLRALFLITMAIVLEAQTAAAFRLDSLAVLSEHAEYGATEVTVRPLSGERFVAAWARRGSIEARARVFGADGSALTDTLSCAENPDAFAMTRPELATMNGDVVVFGCEVESRLPHATLRTYSSDLVPIAPRIDYGGTFSYLDALESADASSYLASVDLCDTDCIHSYDRLDLDGNELGSLVFPRFSLSTLTSHGPSQLLLLGRSRPNQRGRTSLWWQLVSPSGQKLTKSRKAFGAREGELQVARVVAGVGGRTAVLIMSLRRGFNRFRVLLIEPDGTSRTYNPEYLPGYVGIAYPPEAWALPLEHGFAILWSGWRSVDYNGQAQRVWMQEFGESGNPTGDGLALLDPSRISAPVLHSDGESYLIPMETGSSASRTQIFRFGTGTACGDVGGNGDIDDGDASELVALLANDATCDPCICDVDRSGVVDFNDAMLIERSANDQLPLQCSICSD